MVSAGRLIRLDQADSTNTWCKQRFDGLAHGTAVYTTCQTAGRGRRGRAWANAPGQGLYYSIVLRCAMKDPASLPLAASLAAADAIQQVFGLECQIKWPNDLLIAGRKLAGILCEGAPGGIVCGIGVNLGQEEAYFEKNQLPYATSAACALGRPLDLEKAPAALAWAITRAFDARLPGFCREGFGPLRQEYKARCVNLGRTVWCGKIQGRAADVDEAGRLVVVTAQGEQAVFTGEVSVQGIYGGLEE